MTTQPPAGTSGPSGSPGAAPAAQAAHATVRLLVNVDVDDLPRAVAFYTAAFGLRVGRRFGGDAAELLGASAPIYLLRKAAGSAVSDLAAQRRDYARHWCPVHVDVVVDDLDAALASALAAGAVLERPVSDSAWGRLALLADPFGHGWCLVQFVGRGYDEMADAADADDAAPTG